MQHKGVPHLYIRNGVFYFRYRFSALVRKMLGQWELCFSLSTSDFDIASAKCVKLRIYAKVFERLVGNLSKKYLTIDKADELIQWYFKEHYERNEAAFDLDWYAGDFDYSSAMNGDPEAMLSFTKEIMTKNFSNETVCVAEDLMNKDEKLIYPNKGLLKMYFLEGIARARCELHRINIETVRGNFHKRAIMDPMFENRDPNHKRDLITYAGYNFDDHPRKFSELAQKFIEKKSNTSWSTNTIDENKRGMDWACEIIGDKPIEFITTQDMRKVRDMFELLPKNVAGHKLYKKMPILKAIELNGAKNLVSRTTAIKYWRGITGFMNWLVDEGYLETSPAKGLKIVNKKDPMGDRDPFSEEQLRGWFESPIYKGCKSPGRRTEPGNNIIYDGLYWVPLIGLYTGMRLAEIIQMSINDFKYENELWVFYVTANTEDDLPEELKLAPKSVKGQASVRIIPLPDILKKLGFVEFWQKQKDRKRKRIFWDFKPNKKGSYSHQFSKKFSYRLDNMGIKTDKTSFHSFRHNLKDMLNENDILETHQFMIMGHSQKGMNAVYGSKNVKKLKECLDKLNYDIDHGLK